MVVAAAAPMVVVAVAAGANAVTVAIDCCYGPCKRKNALRRHLHLKSSIPNAVSNYCASLQRVGGCCGPWEFSGTWWKGGRTGKQSR